MRRNRNKLLVFFLLVSCCSTWGTERVALIVGNSNYKHLSALQNPINDAPAIERALREIGFKTKLLLDADESTVKRTLKKFSDDSESAHVAFVFYAGHGAQINGENFILPIDMEIPKRDTDIQLSSIKVDDILNSLHSKVKILFLDACRDNPALIKSLSKGRGGFRGGLAPTRSVGIDENSGGVFIAYSTDAGNIALDGEEKNSPFTQALLRYIKKPVSIDDMFSLVTREVRLITKNQQRPYKYASLESVVCLSDDCGGGTKENEVLSEKSKMRTNSSEDQDYEVAKQAKSKALLTSFLEKYPKSSKRREIESTLDALSRDNLNNWVIYETFVATGFPVFYKPSSIKNLGRRTIVDMKILRDNQMNFSGEDKDISYYESATVFDCAEKTTFTFENRYYDSAGRLIRDVRFGDPEYIKLDKVVQGSITDSLAELVCHKEKYFPVGIELVTDSSKWQRFFSYDAHESYYQKDFKTKKRNDSRILVRNEYRKPKNLGELMKGTFEESFDFPKVKYEVLEDVFNCKKKEFGVGVVEGYDENGRLLYQLNYSRNITYQQIETEGPVMQLFNMLCTDQSLGKRKK